MSDKVTELENKIGELQESVDGLLEELVDTKERVNQLESEAEAQNPPFQDERDTDTQKRSDESEDTSDDDDSGSDIIVAELPARNTGV